MHPVPQQHDTQVLPGWLDSLIEVFAQVPEAGIVGSKLVYPSGHLQEAGAVLKKDGTVELVGLNDDPNKPEYNLLREVGHCSGASLLVERALFNENWSRRWDGCDSEILIAQDYSDAGDLAFIEALMPALRTNSPASAAPTWRPTTFRTCRRARAGRLPLLRDDDDGDTDHRPPPGDSRRVHRGLRQPQTGRSGPALSAAVTAAPRSTPPAR